MYMDQEKKSSFQKRLELHFLKYNTMMGHESEKRNFLGFGLINLSG